MSGSFRFVCPKKNFAKALAEAVFPTPVGPVKIKVEIGLLGLFNPVLKIRIRLISRSIARS